MRTVLLKILDDEPDKFAALCSFYHIKNDTGYGLFSCLAGETFPDGWIKAIAEEKWEEKGIYGDNFRKCFGLKTS